MCKGDYWEQSQPHKMMAGRFSRLYGGEISRLGAWGKCQQDRQEAYPHPPVQAGGQSLQTGKSIEATLDGITPFNAGKKKEEALSLLKKWFPQMENFSGQLKKYKVTINDLLAENEQLEARAKASEKGKMKDTWNGQSWKAS